MCRAVKTKGRANILIHLRHRTGVHPTDAFSTPSSPRTYPWTCRVRYESMHAVYMRVLYMDDVGTRRSNDRSALRLSSRRSLTLSLIDRSAWATGACFAQKLMCLICLWSWCTMHFVPSCEGLRWLGIRCGTGVGWMICLWSLREGSERQWCGDESADCARIVMRRLRRTIKEGGVRADP